MDRDMQKCLYPRPSVAQGLLWTRRWIRPNTYNDGSTDYATYVILADNRKRILCKSTFATSGYLCYQAA